MLLCTPITHSQPNEKSDIDPPPVENIQRWLLPRGATIQNGAKAQSLKFPTNRLLEVQINIYPAATCQEVKQHAIPITAGVTNGQLMPMSQEQLANYGAPESQHTVFIVPIASFTLPKTAAFDTLEVPVGPLWLGNALRQTGENTTVFFDTTAVCSGKSSSANEITVIPKNILLNSVDNLSIPADQPFSARIIRNELLSIGVGEYNGTVSIGFGFDPNDNNSYYHPSDDWKPLIRLVSINNKDVLTQRSALVTQQQEQAILDPAIAEVRALKNQQYQRPLVQSRQRSPEVNFLLGFLAFFGSILAAPLALMIILAISKRLLIRLLIAFQRWRCTFLSTSFPLTILAMLLVSPLLVGLSFLLGVSMPPFLVNALSLLFGLLAICTVFVSLSTLTRRSNKTSYYTIPLEIIIPVSIVFMLSTFFLVQSIIAQAKLALIPLLSVSSFISWRAAVRDSRYYTSLPAAKIATVAQGNAHIVGKVIAQGKPLTATISGQDAIWYHSYEIHFVDKRFFSFHTEKHGGVIPFLIDDESDRCAVVPEDTRFYIHEYFTDYRFDGPYGVFEVSIEPGQSLYAYGNFRTQDAKVKVNIEQKAQEILSKWKYDPAARKRFDLNEDGLLSQQEIQLALSAARREARRQSEYYLSDEYLQSTTRHRLGKDDNGKPCIITDLSPAEISERCRKVSWLHLAAFFATIPWLVYTGHRIVTILM